MNVDSQEELIPIRKVCKLIGLKANTIRSWADTGKIRSIRTPSGQRLFPKSQLQSIMDDVSSDKEKENFLYCRVSSKKQHWKTIDYLIKNYKHILLPEFDSQEMMGKNKSVNRDLNLLKHYKFKCRLKERINEINDLHVYIVDESYTSKTCSQCGTMNNSLGSNKTFYCSNFECKNVMDRDINASRNILIKHCC